MRFVRWRHHAILRNTNGIECLTKSIVMDQLAPLLRQITLSAHSFFSVELCQLVSFYQTAGHVHILKSGKISMTVRNGPPAVIDQPSVIFFPRACEHRFIPLEGEDNQLLCAYIDLGAQIGSPLALSLPEVMVLPMEVMSPIKPTLEMLFNEAFTEAFGRQAAIDRLIEYFLIQILRHVIATGHLQSGIFAALSDARLKHAVGAMHDKPGHPWTLDELADIAGMSRARFAVNFRETVGTTPLDYLTDWRISIAQNLLKQGQPIKTVAAAVGYQSQAALSRVFARRVGIAPAQWLKQLET